MTEIDMDMLLADIEAFDDTIGTPPEERFGPINSKAEMERRYFAFNYRRRELAAINRSFDEHEQVLKARRDDLTSGLKREIEHLELQLTQWHRAVYADDDRETTITTAAGKLTSREGSVKLDKPTGADLADHAERLEETGDVGDEVVKLTWSIDATKMKALIDVGKKGQQDRPFGITDEGVVIHKQSGELFDQLQVQVDERSFTIPKAK